MWWKIELHVHYKTLICSKCSRFGNAFTKINSKQKIPLSQTHREECMRENIKSVLAPAACVMCVFAIKNFPHNTKRKTFNSWVFTRNKNRWKGWRTSQGRERIENKRIRTQQTHVKPLWAILFPQWNACECVSTNRLYYYFVSSCSSSSSLSGDFFAHVVCVYSSVCLCIFFMKKSSLYRMPIWKQPPPKPTEYIQQGKHMPNMCQAGRIAHSWCTVRSFERAAEVPLDRKCENFIEFETY